MARPSGSGLRAFYLFCLKAAGLLGLPFVPLLAFAAVSGLVATPGLLIPAVAITLLAVPASLVMVSDKGLARLALRPRSFGGAILSHLVISLLASMILVQALLTLLAFDLPVFLNVTGLRGALAPMLVIDPASQDLEALLFVLLLAPVGLLSSLASLLVFAVRFDRAELDAEFEPAPAKASRHASAPAIPVRVRPPEHDAALRAMRRRMADRQAAAQNAV